jgi:hypothetical protein
MLLKSIFICCLLLLSGFAKAQHHELDSVAVNLRQYGLNTVRSGLFVHFDKNIYTNNDQVWFTGYLLSTVAKVEQYHTLYLSLVNNADTSIVLQEKFLIEQGVSFGSLVLPDSLPSGDYRFVAHTNMKFGDQFDAEFTQQVSIRSTTISPLIANISVFKTYDERTKRGTALLQVLTGDNHFVENAEITYAIGNTRQAIASGKAKSSIIGELMIDYPAEQITKENNLLKISIKKGNHVKHLDFNLPVKNELPYQLNFYPEGGYLVNGLTTKVGLALNLKDGHGIQGKVVIYQDDEVLDTVSTSVQGIGSFVFRPDRRKYYYAKILGEVNTAYQYDLPIILAHGVVLRLGSAISNHELKAQIESYDQQRVHLIVHDFSNILLQSSLNLQANRPQNIRFKLDSLPIGLYTLTVLDNQYKPIAERIFFAHYNNINRVEITTDKDRYTTRDRVEVDLRAVNQDKLLHGLVSVSCVQANRLLIQKNQNITDFYFFENLLADLLPHQFGLKYNDVNYLNEVLLVKGWRRYQWPIEKLPQASPKFSSLEYRGQILKKNKPLKLPLMLNTFGASNINTIKTDSTGRFSLSAADLFSGDRGRVWLNISDKNYANYMILLNDPFDEVKKQLRNQKVYCQRNEGITINDLNHSINISKGIKLKDVVIKFKKDDVTFANKGSNSCGDYICLYNILNCANHAGNLENRKPLKGKSYMRTGGGTIIYAGCTDHDDKPNLKILKGISLAKDFYTSDVSNVNEPINFPTLYWNYQVALEKSGSTKLVFNTGDLKGKFKIIVQGITSEGVAYGEQTFDVVAK